MALQKTAKKNDFCYFCVNGIQDVDYKDASLLRQFMNSYMKILPKRRTSTCAKHQRKLATAIKRARIMVLVPFVRR
ncbi:MAG: 30S ribosomal protein S18 [Parcubacteria group bacterium CG08_land_8_20_14_0_20_48_21]|nr:MAG: 30S ribosomal protein S18 [Parcubacteria group bacterium CG2_30_48_51]PIS33104.1 MAG: 30S ribosomal protein S18 [Parcubacteria group bacterium CG08_land_8_20_14_0_20_48_21]PIW79244.1 MAG: 30S ribosomal protein S18 [Parcubacteria group bacterium CG_4_8_14_3_um_filter_48_16]PIY78308.1 MAG: 30S ribosomal protein S18 [Parcubacteria group bacterium CG_4_10_14_0_8_um_filter_48_154]PIZ77695.1 MAG: 30S ribosomal protein S18 [bacterium CG_4_10_14_0_2_um_filter_48_144]PJC39549.1 MAG: 30S ribosom